MRSQLSFLVLAVTSCGTQFQPGSPQLDVTDPLGPDARAAATGDGAIGDPATGDAALTICQQATTHADFAWIAATVLTPSCARAACHTASAKAAGLSLETDQALANLVGQPTTTQSGWIRVVAGDPDASYLMVALGAVSGPPPHDGTMPLNAAPLCIEQSDAIERWIAAGAD